MKSGKKSARPPEKDPATGCKNGAPKAYDETAIKDRFWQPDPCDEILPKRLGFLTDCVLRHRGKEITTLFTLWSTLFVLSSAVKRQAWLRFGTKRLYTNFYYILVGPAGIAHKTEAINDAVRLLKGFGKYLEGHEWKIMKTINVVADKASPEALLEAIHPRNKEPLNVRGFFFRDKDGGYKRDPKTGNRLWYSKTAEAAIVAHEFATFAGNQRYNVGLTDNLLALYECDEPFSWRTVKRKQVVLRDLHTTLIAGTTLGAFRTSITDSVRTDGFLSRSIIVYCPKTPGRRFSRPRVVEGAPSEEELQKRLAWISENAVGEYDLSPEANAYYDNWYTHWREDIENDSQFQGMRSRLNILILKVALLLRLQRYDPSSMLVDEQDIKEAILIVQRTWFEALPIMRGFEGKDDKPFIGRMEGYIRERGTVPRLKLLRQGHFTSAEVREGINMLSEEGKVEITLGDTIRSYASSDSNEVYRWIGEKWLGRSALDER